MGFDGFDQIIGGERLSHQDQAIVYDAPNSHRYDYFVKRVARMKLIWALLEAEGWVTTTGRDRAERFLVWPDEIFARRALEEEGGRLWPNVTVNAITLEDWLEKYLPNIASHGDKVWVFPARNLNGGVVEPNDLLRDLRKEINWLKHRR